MVDFYSRFQVNKYQSHESVMASRHPSLLLGEILQGAHVVKTLGGIVAIRVNGLATTAKRSLKNSMVPTSIFLYLIKSSESNGCMRLTLATKFNSDSQLIELKSCSRDM